MREITVTISEPIAGMLLQLAERFGITPEAAAVDILCCHAQAMNPSPDSTIREDEFQKALTATLTKNAELYRRLAQH